MPIDQTRDRISDPLGSVVDEWYPRRLGGDPLDPTNCTEQHRVCGGVKGGRWPVTPAMQARARELHDLALTAERDTTKPALTRTC